MANGQFTATGAMQAIKAVHGVSTTKQLTPATSKQEAITQKIQNDAGNRATEERVQKAQEKSGLQLGQWTADPKNPGTMTRQLVNRNLTGQRDSGTETDAGKRNASYLTRGEKDSSGNITKSGGTSSRNMIGADALRQRVQELEEQDKTYWTDWDWMDYWQKQADLKNAETPEKEINNWDGRDALIQELKRIDDAAGWVIDTEQANQNEARRTEIIRTLEEGDALHGNGLQSYDDTDRARQIFSGASKDYAAGVVNKVGNEMAMGYAGVDTNPYAGWATDEVSRANIPYEHDEAQMGDYQFLKAGAEKMEHVADRIGESAAKDLESAKAGLNGLGKAGVDIATNVIQMGYDAMLGKALGGGLVPMYLRSSGSAARQARLEGADVMQQYRYGVATGAIEAGTEMLGNGVSSVFSKVYGKGLADDAAEEIIRRVAESDTGRSFLRFLGGGIGEGTEEVVADLLSPLAQALYKQDSIGQLYRALDPKEIGYDFIIGAAIGWMGSAAGAATGANQVQNEILRAEDRIQDKMKTGMTRDQATSEVILEDMLGRAQEREEEKEEPAGGANGLQEPNKNKTPIMMEVGEDVTEPPEGYDVIAYHGGSGAALTAHPGDKWFSSSKEDAKTYGGDDDSRVKKTAIRLGKNLEVDARGAMHDDVDLWDVIPELAEMRERYFDRYSENPKGLQPTEQDYETIRRIAETLHTEFNEFPHSTIDQVVEYARANGYDSVTARNIVDTHWSPEGKKNYGRTAPATDYIVLDKNAGLWKQPTTQQEGESNETIQQETTPEQPGLPGQTAAGTGEGGTGLRLGATDEVGAGAGAGTSTAVSEVRTDVSGGSTGRDLGGRAGGEAGRVEQNAGPGSRATADGERRRAVGESIRNALRERGVEAQSSNSIGISSGTDKETFYIVPDDLMESGWIELRYQIQMATGYEVLFVAGPMEVVGADGKLHQINGCCDNDNQRITVRVDSGKYSPNQIGRHEEFHARADQDPGLVREVRARLVARYSREEMAKILTGYIKFRRGINDIENGGQDVFNTEYDQLWEEVFADAYGGMNAFGLGANRFWYETVTTLADRYNSRSTNGERITRGPPNMEELDRVAAERADLYDLMGRLYLQDGVYHDRQGNTYTEEEAEQIAQRYAELDEQYERLVGQMPEPGSGETEQPKQEGGQRYAINYPTYTDEDLRKNSIKLQQMEIVKMLSGDEFEANGKTLYENVLDFFNSLGNSVASEEFGDVALSPSSVRSDIRHGSTREKIIAYAAIPEVIQNGTVIYTIDKGFGLERIVTAAPIRIGEQKYYMAVMLQRDPSSQRLYAHDVVIAEEPTSSAGRHLDTNRAVRDGDKLFITDILQNALSVKEDSGERQEFSASEEEWPEGTLVNRRAIVSEETLDRWLKDYAASNPEYAQAFIAYVSPEKFLNLTTSGAASRHAIRQQAEGLTLPSVMDYSKEQPIQLRIDTETGKVEGHEGRHRMVALNRAGVEEVPVLLFDSSNKYGKRPMESIRLIQQDFNNRENTGTEIVRDLEPLSTGNRDTVRDKFSKKDVYERMNEKYSGKKTVQFSASEEDSLGNQLTERQQEYFKDSVIRDDKGRLKVMYRGGQSEISVFDRSKSKYSNLYGRGFYFTDSEEHANQYGTARSYYLDIRHPVQPGTHEIRQDEIREFLQAVADNEDYGLENYGYGATVDSVLQSLQGRDDFGVLQDINATAIGDFAAAIELFNETNGTDFDGIVVPTETVAFYSEQIKLTGNKNPTNSKDVHFSMSEEVEETDRLVAVHNKSVSGLRRMLERGGVPFPSIAIKKAGAPHEGFGDVSIVFPRSTIDPEVNRQNRIYSNDAWTPTEPRVEYDVGNTYRYQKKLRKQIGDELFDALRGSSYLEESELSNRLAYNKGNVVEALSDLSVLKYAYLQSIGETPEVPTRDQPLDRNGRFDNEQLQAIFNLLSEEEIANLKSGTETAQKVADILNFMYETKFPPDSKMRAKLKEKPLYDMEDIRPYAIRDAYQRWLDNGKQIVPEYDYYEFDRVMRGNDAIEKDEGYHKWLQETFKDLIVDEGIRNDKDLFTSSGNRRSFKQLHVPATLDNIVREMQKQEETGVGALGINLRGAATKAYKSVEDARSESGKLLGTHVSDEVYDSYMKEFYNRFHEIAVKAAGENAGIGKIDTTEEILLEAVRDSNTKRAMENKLQRESKWFNKYDGITDELWQLKMDVQNMPAPYFEAKPRRIVYPGEALAYILPDNADEDIVRILEDRGYNVLTYKAGDNEDRLEKLNSVPNARFSVAEDEDQITMDDLTEGDYSLSATVGPRHERELARILKSHVKDLLVGYQAEGRYDPITEEDIDDWMDADEYHDSMASLFNDGEQVLDELYLLSEDEPWEREEIYYLMERIVRTLDPETAQKYTMENVRRETRPAEEYYSGLKLQSVVDATGEYGSDYPNFARWYNSRNPSIYYPDYEPGDLFDAGKNIQSSRALNRVNENYDREMEYLRSLIDDPSVSEETRKDAEDFYNRMANPHEQWTVPDANGEDRTYREIFYSTDEDSDRRESTGEEELGEARLTEAEKEIEELKKINKDLEKYAEYWKRQGRITGKGENRARRSDVQRFARELTEHAGYQGDKMELQQKLQDLANMIVSGDSGNGLNWSSIHEAAEEIAELLVDNSYQMVDPEKDTRENRKTRLKELKIRPDEMWTHDFGDWADFRRKQFGKLVFSREGQGIDDVYKTLRSEFGDGMFPETVTSGSDQINQILKKLNELQPEMAYNFANDEEAEMAVSYYTNRVADELLFGNIREELSQADKNYQKVKERMQKAEQKVKQLRVEKQELQRMQRHEVQAALQEQRKNLHRREETQKLRKKIDKTAKRLLKYLDENTGKNPIPEPMKEAVGNLLLNLDISGGMEKHQKERYLESMQNVAKIVAQQFDYMNGQDNVWDGMYLDLPPDIRQELDEHLENVRKAIQGEENRGRTWNPNMMNLEELQRLDEILTAVSSAIQSANEILSDERGRKISEEAKPAIAHLNRLGKDKNRSGRKEKLNSFLRFQNTTPYYFFRKLGDAGTRMFERIQDGWDKFAFNAKQVIDFANETYTAKEAKEIQDKVETFQLRRKGDMSEGFDKPETVRMTHAQIMSLYCLWKREQARGHIAGAGIRIADFKDSKGKNVKQAENYLIDLDDIAKMIDTLSEREKEIANKLQKYMNTVGSDWGNEVSLRRFGIRSFTEDNYFPIETDDRTRPVRSPERDSTDLYRLLNMGFTKSTVRNASNALVVNNIFDVFANHMADMAKYNGLGLPLLDTLKWFSYNQQGLPDENGQYGYESIQKSAELAYGKEARKYFTNFMKDLNGVREGGRGLDGWSRFFSNYKVAAVGANLRVALLQPTSYVRAMAAIDGKYLRKGLKMDNKQGREEALKHSGTAVWKGLGFYDTNINAGLRDIIKHTDGWKEKVQDVAMKGTETGDKITWGALWNACKAEQMDKGLKGDELLEATAKRFREVIYRTQVMDSTMTRSDIMRQKDGLMSFYTAFMSEPTVSYNMLMDAFGDYEADRRKGMSKKAAWKKDSGKIGRTLAAYASTAALAAVVESLIDAARDDDEYATYLERLTEKLLGFNPKDPDATLGDQIKGLLTGNAMEDLMLHNKLPVVKDLAGMLVGNNPSRMDTEWFGNVVKALNIWRETLALQMGWQDEPTDATYNGNMTVWGKIYTTLRALSQVTGVPLGNGIRDAVALWNTTAGGMDPEMKIQTYDPGEEKKIKYAVQDGYLSEEEALNWLMHYELADDENEAKQMVYVWAHPEKYERLLSAMNAEDRAEFDAAKDELHDLRFKNSSIEAAIKNEIHERYVGRDGEEPIDRETAKQMLMDYGGMIERKAEEQIQKWTSEVETGVAFNEISDAYVAGDITKDQAAEMLMQYGKYADDKAEAQVQKWTSEIETGIRYSDIGDSFLYDEITRDEAVDMYMKYGGKTLEEAEDAVNKIAFKKATGHERERAELQAMYMEEGYDRDKMKEMMVQYGYSKTEESAENSLIRWDFIGTDYEELDAVSPWQAKRYFELVDDAEIDKKTYLQFAEQAERLKADYDENGKAIAYSKMNKVFALIDSLDLTDAQKTALAEAGWDSSNDGYSAKNIEKYAPWEGGTPKNTTKKKSGGGGRRGGGGGRGSSRPTPGTLELGSIVNTGHRGIFDQILAGWKRKKYSRAQILALVRTGKLTQEEADEILATKQEVEEETDGGLVLGG